MSLTRKRILTFIVAIALIFTCTAVLSTTSSYAASKPAKVSNVKITKVSSTKIKITWKKAKNAKKYQIYRADDIDKAESNKFKKVATTSKTSYTAKLSKKGNVYIFKIRGINGKTNGTWSWDTPASIEWFDVSGMKVSYADKVYTMTNNTGKTISIMNNFLIIEKKGEEEDFAKINILPTSTGVTETKDSITFAPGAAMKFQFVEGYVSPQPLENVVAEFAFCPEKNDDFHYAFWNSTKKATSWKPSVFDSSYRTDY